MTLNLIKIALAKKKKNNFERIGKTYEHNKKIRNIKKSLQTNHIARHFLMNHFGEELKDPKHKVSSIAKQLEKDINVKQGRIKQLARHKRENVKELRNHKSFKTNRKIFRIIRDLKKKNGS